MQQQRRSTRRRGDVARTTTAVLAREGRIKVDGVKGGIKVFNGKDDGGGRGGARSVCGQQRLNRNPSDGATLDKKKGKQCRPPEADKSPIQLRKTLSEPLKLVRDSDDSGGDSSDLSGDGEVGNAVDVEEEEEKGGFDDKEVDLAAIEIGREMVEEDEEEEDKKIDQIHGGNPSISSIAEENPPYVLDCRENDPCHEIPLPMDMEDKIYGQNMSGAQNKMQNIADLVMWREVSRSALVFGSGTFILISSSYTKDLNFSLISAISYMGLIYLAAIFFHKSILQRREVRNLDDYCNQRLLVGEAEATWLIKKLLPYINELLLKTKSLFSGDPATTMKMAMTLFVLARCGGSINIWTMAKLAFFGAFTVPRIWSSYSVHIDRYGTFLLERSRDAWESCAHKKGAAVAAFAVVWNISSAAARTWGVFMVLVLVRYYYEQRRMTESKWNDDDGDGDGNGKQTAEELSPEASEGKRQQPQQQHSDNARACGRESDRIGSPSNTPLYMNNATEATSGSEYCD